MSKDKKISLSIFFPAYNEEENIATTVAEADRVATRMLETYLEDYEIIVVNDGSRDRTGEIADRLVRENVRVRVVHHRPNQGYGAAVFSGIQAARYPYVFFTDADRQFDLAEIEKLLTHIPEHRVVIGYRAPRRDPFMRLVNAKGWNILNRLLFGLKVRDIDCAFKLFERDLVASLPIESRGAMLSAEMLIRLNRLGVKFKEVPVTHLPRQFGTATGANPQVILRAFRELFRVYQGDLGRPGLLQGAKFASVGVVNTLVDIAAYWALTRFVGLFAAQLLVAKTLSFFLGTITSFTLNRRWTFGLRDRVRGEEVLRFYATVISSMIVNVTSTGLLIFFGLYDLVAVLIATVVTFGWSFLLSRDWVFRRAKTQLPASTNLAKTISR